MKNLPGTTALLAVLFAPLASAPALAQGQLERGSTRLSVNVSSGRAFDSNYFIIGLGAGYYIGNGLELGLDTKAWLGGRHDVYDISPSVTYTLTQFDSFMPYVGLLYQRTFLEELDDLSAYGGRAGFMARYSGNLLLRAGVVAIKYQDCQARIYEDCSEVYPELAVSIHF